MHFFLGALSVKHCTSVKRPILLPSLMLGDMQLMHSFEVDIRICQPENSDVQRGEPEVNITFEG